MGHIEEFPIDYHEKAIEKKNKLDEEKRIFFRNDEGKWFKYAQKRLVA